jgi:Tol biopolymer transport system component
LTDLKQLFFLELIKLVFKQKIALNFLLALLIIFLSVSCIKLTKQDPISEVTPVYSEDALPAGGRIAYISVVNSKSQIYIMNGDGTNQINISDNGFDEFGFSWSPDGREIAFTSDRYGKGLIYLINPNGSGRKNLTDDEFWYGYPSWSPDGKKIAFVSGQPEILNSQANIQGQIYVMNASGDGINDLSGNVFNDWYPTWAPDGKKIAFVSYKDSNPQIYVMNADGTDRANLSGTDSDGLYPTWAPDGKKIAFVSYKDSNPQIYVMNADGTDRANLSSKG